MLPPKPERLTVAIEGAVARITLANPPLNVIDIAMMEQLAETLADLETTPCGDGHCVCRDRSECFPRESISRHTSLRRCARC